jgi:hypothetical protein
MSPGWTGSQPRSCLVPALGIVMNSQQALTGLTRQALGELRAATAALG